MYRSTHYDALERFKVPEDQVNIAALAQGYCLYTRICITDAEVLDRDPMRRIKIEEQTMRAPNVTSSWLPESLVPIK